VLRSVRPTAGTAAAAAATGSALAAPSITTLIACGGPVGQEVRIVDPASRAELPEGAVGEILVLGPNVGLGYWKRAEQSAEVFGARLPGTGEQPWLRTGDLGAIHSGLLLVTGRLKDLLIIDGRNHYPQDVEETVHAALDADRRERAAVFAVPGEEGESVVAVAERRRDRMKRDARTHSGQSSATASSASSAHGASSAEHIDHDGPSLTTPTTSTTSCAPRSPGRTDCGSTGSCSCHRAPFRARPAARSRGAPVVPPICAANMRRATDDRQQ
jgi:acyl-CoA synthetase (AMP-forming)/AMP-acid ligase II